MFSAFQSARLKLTGWYFLIIMLISVAFSLGMYRLLTAELDRVEQVQRLRIERRFTNPFFPNNLPPDIPRQFLDPDIIEETKSRIGLILIVINVGVLGVSTIAGYFLAGRTLRPIQVMVDEQNQFITDASHELRTPLTSLKTELEVNLRDKKLTLPQAKKILQSNLEDVNNLQLLSDSLIKLTQYRKGTNGFGTIEELNPAEVVNEAFAKVAKIADKKQIVLQNRIKTPATLEGNKPTLTELFVILFDNAIKYSPQHTVVTVNSEKADHSVFFYVADQGMGIAKKDIPFIFDRFYRTDKSRTKADTGGYGLGLAIAKQIAEKHQGSISVKNSSKKGTTFAIQLPLKQHA